MRGITLRKTLTFTAVVQAASLNYGEGFNNLSELKKFHRADGETYTFASRQSVRYDLVRLGNELFDWNINVVEQQGGSVVQFKRDATIQDSQEMDLFGYLKTGNPSLKRSAVARLSHAVSLEPYQSDMEFLNNMGMAQRKSVEDQAKMTNSLVQIENHQSFYAYTMSVDLNSVGIDGDVKLSNEVRKTRVHQLLEILKILNRDIRGRRENLSPLFVVGGVYPVSNPFFMGRVQLQTTSKGMQIDSTPLSSIADMTFMDTPIGAATRVGQVDGVFADNNERVLTLFENRTGTVEKFFQHLKDEVSAYYAE